MFICACSDVGKVRDVNQDAYFYLEDEVLPIFIIADGMGGHRAGEVASNETISTVVSHYQENKQKIIDGKMFIPEFINESVSLANEKLIYESENDDELKGMGTTITMCLVLDNELFIGHVGDSRAYLVRDNKLTQLTQDHSLVGELLRTGSITKEEAINHPKKNVILRAIGADKDLKIDVFTRDLESGDTIVLCTDGLTNMVSEEKILSTINNEEDSFGICAELVNVSNETGGIDNTTIMLIKAEEE